MANNQAEKIVAEVDADLEELIPDYLDNRQKDINAIKEAVEKEDFETIRILGHSMKGSGGGYGFDGISDIGRYIEEKAKQCNAGDIRKLTDDLSGYLEHVEIVYV